VKSTEVAPQLYARIAGLIYLLVILFGGFSEGFVMNTLVIPHDMAATARNIVKHPALWDLSLAGNLIIPLIAIIQLWIEYLLLRPVNRNLAGLFVLLNLASLAVEAVSKVFLILIKMSLMSAQGGVPADAALALAGFALEAHNVAFNITLVFFGAACLVSGRLIFRSGYFPWFVGLLMQAAGASYLIASISELVLPGLARIISPAILLLALVGESTFCLVLLIRGVDLKMWNLRTAGAYSAGSTV